MPISALAFCRLHARPAFGQYARSNEPREHAASIHVWPTARRIAGLGQEDFDFGFDYGAGDGGGYEFETGWETGAEEYVTLPPEGEGGYYDYEWEGMEAEDYVTLPEEEEWEEEEGWEREEGEVEEVGPPPPSKPPGLPTPSGAGGAAPSRPPPSVPGLSTTDYIKAAAVVGGAIAAGAGVITPAQAQQLIATATGQRISPTAAQQVIDEARRKATGGAPPPAQPPPGVRPPSLPGAMGPSVVDQVRDWSRRSTVIAGVPNSYILYGGVGLGVLFLVLAMRRPSYPPPQQQPASQPARLAG